MSGMTADNDRGPDQDDIMASRRRTWGAFIKFSTYSIVGICLILIGLAVFLL
jgi:hypothetical protein